MARKAIPKTDNYPDLVYPNRAHQITITDQNDDSVSLTIPEFEELISKAYGVLWETRLWAGEFNKKNP